MKRILKIACVVLLGGAALVFGEGKKKLGDDAARAAAVKLFDSLTDEQRKLAVKDFADKERLVEDFPAGNRPGLPMDKLSDEQKKLVEEAVQALTSEYGAERCLAVAKQTGEGRRFINFFGSPKPDRPFAWRLCLHHLTLVYAEFGKDKTKEFGPVLLGGNPVNTLWDEEEKLALALRANLSAEEAKAVQSKGSAGSGQVIGKEGMRIGDLAEKPRELARKLLKQRLAVFSDDRRKVLEELIRAEGGVDDLRVAFWGDASKSHRDGGNYSWKIGGATVLCDWQTVGKNHIHMTVRGKSS
jgi:hypothetical protein